MSKYCCFFCPEKDHAEKSLDDLCPKCQRPYGFVLSAAPASIRDYRITRDLGRGFYGAAYVAERGTFAKKHVLKISPIEFYKFFEKPSFEEETSLHARLAQDAMHVVGIDDRFDEEVEFADGSKIRCHVTVLEFVNGDLLRKYIDGEIAAGSAAICQIAIDLLRIRGEFAANQLNHNDLHAENLIVEKIRTEARRPNAICDTIRVKAIDLGSISDASKSSPDRIGDLHFIAKHVDQLLDRLLSSPNNLEDRDFRTALALQRLVHGLLANAQNLRSPNPDDLIAQIEEAYYRASYHWRPWSTPLSLKSFGDHYNAQTLESWNVPRLLVDPDGRWLAEVSKPGPQIITGMRGCGKTMLLRALDIHARAAQHEGESGEAVLKRVHEDQFVGLFVSAQRLLDLRHSVYKLEHRLTRLFVNYAMQAARALLHLKDIDSASLAPGAHAKLASAVADYLDGADELRQVVSVEDLEVRLQRIAVLTTQGDETYSVKQAPVQVFSHLAEQLRSCSPYFASSTILFLLDDVSTRYLELDRIAELLSALLFQSPICAFKFTSEWQTIELGLQSPGRNHPIRVDRDLAVFDLGADVFQTINSDKEKGNAFVADILQQRAKFHVSHPNKHGPREMLGDVPLEQVAREIAASNATSKERKQAYRGLSCLTSVCVGDIGDVIKLYEEILRRAAGAKGQASIPIPESIQSDCFLALSSRRLYDLDRRTGRFKNHALAFAGAAHELLARSYRQAVKLKSSSPRLRQYSSIYVRVTADDEASLRQQIDGLRDLIDAGVFVYTGGSPRTKTKDSNPIQQFKLSYRKIYGLAAFIGLADRDRFELSGPDLREWLDSPAKEILLRNQIKAELGTAPEEESREESQNNSTPDQYDVHAVQLQPGQQNLFEDEPTVELDAEKTSQPRMWAKAIDVEIRQITTSDLEAIQLGGVLTALGFEDRTLESNRILAEHARPGNVFAVRYNLPGHSKKILRHWKAAKRIVHEVDYDQALNSLPAIEGLALVDVSGLSKPLIFQSVRRELIEKGRVLICHVSAEHHYPLQADLKKLFAAEKSDDPLRFLENLSHVLKGETGPYKDVRLLDEHVDPSRNRALLAFASAKHERLFSLLDKREFDYIEVIAPTGDEPRSKVAQYAAEFLCQNYQNATVNRIDTSDLFALLKYLDEQFLDVYGNGGANLEIGLTGSKMQAVASAILSARRRVAQAWYLSPQHFDEKRFSRGVGAVRIFDVSVVKKEHAGAGGE
ncbi:MULTISPECIES: serine/threonine-protein kinase [Burkholderia]|uniref:ORC-CDC6 family AAA ATPase n=1 Tax=Burkholderia TaxID=32008 RepID=UPI00158D979C|nr:serine/threonine-protein kinase [Burkholderia sp. BCC0398]